MSSIPPSLGTADGSLQHTIKSTLLHHLESKNPEIILGEPPNGAALILAGMAVIQQLADVVPRTFGDLGTFLFKYIIKLACSYDAPRVDFVCDR